MSKHAPDGGMLVLGRRRNQSVYIGDDKTEVKVLGVDTKGRVTLGIKAPKDVSIYRDEIYPTNAKEDDNHVYPAE
jgi:carbon storage regulator